MKEWFNKGFFATLGGLCAIFCCGAIGTIIWIITFLINVKK